MWRAVLLGASAGGLGWGIRGQYGHETGAMLAGLLIGLALTLYLCPKQNAAGVVRAVAWLTVAIGLGGSMTYGQTVGLTQDSPLVGHWAALRWGMLGLAIKGSIWIGFAGCFFGMGLSGIAYSARWMALSWLAMLGVCAFGIWLINEPFDPAHRILPRIYFSDDWRWEPVDNLKPRREVWGGLLLALLAWLSWVRWQKQDRLAFRMGGWGMLGGALGFPLGQSLQAYHAWNVESFRQGSWAAWDPVINWWNFMETTYGFIMGGVLAFGLWMNRGRIAPTASTMPTLAPPFEWALVLIHVVLLTVVEFTDARWAGALYDFGMLMAALPLIGIAGGRYWAYLVILPITALPYLGKTIRQVVYAQGGTSPTVGWLIFGILPLAWLVWRCWKGCQEDSQKASAESFLRPTLLGVVWLYFVLNFAFFRWPWPWQTWTGRTPNGFIFAVFAIILTLAASVHQNARPKTTDSRAK